MLFTVKGLTEQHIFMYSNNQLTDGSSEKVNRGHIFSHVWPFYERVVSNLDRSMHITLLIQVAHSSFIEGSLTTENMASEQVVKTQEVGMTRLALFLTSVWCSKSTLLLLKTLFCCKMTSVTFYIVMTFQCCPLQSIKMIKNLGKEIICWLIQIILNIQKHFWLCIKWSSLNLCGKLVQ